MNTLIHSIEASLWTVTFAIGLVIGAIVWIAMALWDTIRGIFHRINGEMDRGNDPS